jgi:DNA-binding Xre family transcriptional regulator
MDTDVLIDVSKAKNLIKTDTDLAKRIGISRQSLSIKRKHPGTFTGYELKAMMKHLNWTPEELADFIQNI